MDEVDLLLVEDEKRDATRVERLLIEGIGDRLPPVGVRRADCLSAAIEQLTDTPDAVLLDLNLPDSDGLATVEAVVEEAPGVPVVVVTGRVGDDLGRQAIQRGAQDYLRKGHITAEVVGRTLQYAIDRQETQREIAALNRRLSLLNRLLCQEVRTDLHRVVGHGDQLRQHVSGEGTRTLDALVDAADSALDRTRTAREVMRALEPGREHAREPLDIAAVLEAQVERAHERVDGQFALATPAGNTTVGTSPALGLAFAHLLDNGIRHNDSDQPRVRVTVEAGPEAVSVAIADNGVGIPERQRTLLGDPEQRYHEDSGLGTGLYLALTVVEQAGGSVTFAENEPRGTVVTVTVPRTDELCRQPPRDR
jgi:signal transduction histidine kinase